ncbi:MAG: tripartite tricarboxylate transporter TctB family protein [Pseudomonadota bacterium]
MSKLALADVVPALLFLLLGGWLLRETLLIGDDFAIGVGLHAGTYPMLLAVTTLVLAAMLLLRAVVRARSGASIAPDATEQDLTAPGGAPGVTRPRKVLGALAAVCLYTLVLHTVGFLFATPFLLAAVMLLAGERRPLFIAVTAVVLTVAVQALVFYGFAIVLPEGPLRYLYS